MIQLHNEAADLARVGADEDDDATLELRVIVRAMMAAQFCQLSLQSL